MSAALLTLGARALVVIVLWLFVAFIVLALRRDITAAAGVTASAGSGRGWRAPRLKQQPSAAAAVPRQLEVIDGPLAGSHIVLAGYNSITIGRHPDCTFRLSDECASGRHAALILRGTDWFIDDLASRNGTLVDGRRIDSAERVTCENSITIGNTTLRLTP